MEKKKKKMSGYNIGSIRVKISVLVIVVVIMTAGLDLWTIIPNARKTVGNVTQNYMEDMGKTNGSVLETAVAMTKGRDLTTEEYGQILDNIKIKDVDSAYAYLVAADGTMLYHPTKEKIGKKVENEAIAKVAERLKKGETVEDTTVSYEFQGATKYASYHVTMDKSKILVVCADEEDIMKPVDKLATRCAKGALFALVVCSVIGYFVAFRISKPIRTITKVVDGIANLDFSHKEEQKLLSKKKDETGEMSRAIYVLQDELINVISHIKKQSEELYMAAEGLHTNAEENASAVEQVDKAVQEIADGATSQATETQRATEHVITMGNMIEKSNDEVENLHKNANIMRKSGDEATMTLKELDEINQKAKESIEVIYEQTNTTNESAMKIKAATSLITSIADETNLLSLNASIEAARAGEAGRGFAVVASQIQKLAEQSSDSASQIEEIVNSLIEDSEKAVQTMETVKEIMEQQNEKVVKTNEIFVEVKDGIASSISGVNQISDKTAELDESRTGVVDVVQNLTAIAEENAASTEETSASVTEVGSIMLNVSENAEKLKKIAEELEESMKKFTLGEIEVTKETEETEE